MPAASTADLQRSNAVVRIGELQNDPKSQVRSLARMVSELGVAGCPVAVTLPLGSYAMLQIERPPVEDTELADAARWRIKSQLDYPVEEAVLQVFDVPQPSERHRAPMINVVAAPARALRELSTLVKKAGLRPIKVTVAELAMRDFSARVADGDEAVATVLLSARLGLIQITRGNELLLSRRLDYGLSSVKPADVLATGIHTTLPLELRRTVDYFDSHFSVGGVRRVLAAPAEPTFMSFMQETGQVIGLAVEPLELPATVKPVGGKAADFGLPESYLALAGALAVRSQAMQAAS